MAREEGRGPGFLRGFLSGAAVGTLIGFFLFAPRGGNRARERLQSVMDEYMERLRAAWEEGRGAATEASLELESRFEQAKAEPD